MRLRAYPARRKTCGFDQVFRRDEHIAATFEDVPQGHVAPHGMLDRTSPGRAQAVLSGEHPKPVTGEVLDAVDAVIILGTEAKLEPRDGTRFEGWETDEPSERGIEGMERMRLVRDDIRSQVQKLYTELTGN